MIIKNKIVTIFSFFIFLLILLSICLIASMLIQREYFVKYVQARDKISLLNNILQQITSQRLHFDYYVLATDEKEKENFVLAATRIKQLIDEISDIKEKNVIQQKYIKLLSVVEKVFNQVNKEQRFSLAIQEFFPLYEDITNQLMDYISVSNKEEKKLQRYMLMINLVSVMISVIIIIFALIISANFGVKIYRSLIDPLNTIAEHTSMLAKGEYKEIKYHTGDEFDNVFSAFNRMVKDLKSLQSQIIQMDRLSNIGQLAGGIAHELNNPLVGVLGMAQILYEKLPPDSPLRNYVEKIEQAATRCRESVSRLLQFSRQKEYEYTEVDIVEVINNVLFIADSELKAQNVKVITLFSNNLPKIKVSIPHVQQALLNIINNAIQAMENMNTKTLQIKTYLSKDEETEYVCVEIQDTGCGIEKENLGLLFEPFFTTKDKNKFAGVGLAITKDIILHHKGKITVYSEGKNKGARFTIWLPTKN